jgi:hypothetical protein
MKRISPQLFYQYFTCPSWVWFDNFGDPSKKGESNEMQQKLLEQGVAFEGRFMATYLKDRGCGDYLSGSPAHETLRRNS